MSLLGFLLNPFGLFSVGQQETTPDRQPEEIQIPTANEGSPIPVLFGTRDIKDSNVVWYGDIKAVPIKKKSGGKK